MSSHPIQQIIKKRKQSLLDFVFILVGSLVQALAMRLFLIPGLINSGGISGAAQILHFYTGWPIGVMTLLGNLPLFLLGWRYLGGKRFTMRTALAIVLFSIFTDGLAFFMPSNGITADLMLDSLYGGVLLGVGLGLVYRGRGTSGGTDVLGRILNHHRGIAISQAYLITDGLVVLASGFAFGWDRALYSLMVIYISGLAAELASEGNNLYRMALIITSQPDAVSAQILSLLERGVTVLSGKGAYTQQDRPVLYCVLTRAEVNPLKTIVSEIDPDAFIVIGQANEALGEGFRPLKRT